MQHAACRQRPDLDWFDLHCNAQACYAVCLTCPVVKRCLDYAVDNELTFGMWGGVWGYRLLDLVEGRGS